MQPIPISTAKYPVLDAEGKLGEAQRKLVAHIFKRDWAMQIIVFGTLFGMWKNVGLAQQIATPGPIRPGMEFFPFMTCGFSPDGGWPTGFKRSRDSFKGFLFPALILAMGYRETDSSHSECAAEPRCICDDPHLPLM